MNIDYVICERSNIESSTLAENVFSANNERGSMKLGEKWFPENFEIILTWNIFGPSHSRYVHLRAELPLPSSCKIWLHVHANQSIFVP